MAQVLSSKFCEISKSTFFTEQLWTAASVCKEVINKRVKLELFYTEIFCVGFTNNDLKPFSNLIKTWGINVNHLVSKCIEVACRVTSYIFNRRGKSCNMNDTLNFV